MVIARFWTINSTSSSSELHSNHNFGKWKKNALFCICAVAILSAWLSFTSTECSLCGRVADIWEGCYRDSIHTEFIYRVVQSESEAIKSVISQSSALPRTVASACRKHPFTDLLLLSACMDHWRKAFFWLFAMARPSPKQSFCRAHTSKVISVREEISYWVQLIIVDHVWWCRDIALKHIKIIKWPTELEWFSASHQDSLQQRVVGPGRSQINHVANRFFKSPLDKPNWNRRWIYILHFFYFLHCWCLLLFFFRFAENPVCVEDLCSHQGDNMRKT